MRPIDAYALVKEIAEMHFGDMSSDEFAMVCRIHDMVIDAPTIEAEPMRHGRWEDVSMDTVCSVCGTKFSDEMYWIQGDFMYPKRCPECGAKMDAKEEV